MSIAHFPGYILATIRLFLLILSLTLFVGVGLILKATNLGDQFTAFRIRKFWCNWAAWLLGLKVYATGVLNQAEGNLYVSNHRSLIDAVIVFSFIQNGWAVSKAEVEKYPIISAGAKLSGVVFVDRENNLSRFETRQKIFELLDQKQSVIIYPEGTVSIARGTLPFRKGSFEAAEKANAPIVPIAIEYMDPDRDFWWHAHIMHQYFVTFSKLHTVVKIHFFDPVSTSVQKYDCSEIQLLITEKMREFQKEWKSESYSKLFG